MVLLCIYLTIGRNIKKILETIYYNIIGAINQVFEWIFDGIFYSRNEINYYIKWIEFYKNEMMEFK